MNHRSIRAASVRLATASVLTVGLTAGLTAGLGVGLMAPPATAVPVDTAVARTAVAPTAAGAKPAAAKAAASAYAAFGFRVLSVAASKRGAPYRYGAAGPSAFDCSGYTSWVYRKLGRSLPRTAQAQYRALKRIPRSSARPGDLVFFGGSYKHHVGIFAGGNRMWHAPSSGRTVTLAKIYSSRVTFGRM